MAKRTIKWAFPGLAFIVAVVAMIASAPSWASLSRRTLFTASSNGTIGCKDCCSSDGQYASAANTAGAGNPTQYCALSTCPVNYFTGENVLASASDLHDHGYAGMTTTRHYVTIGSYCDNTFGLGWRHGVPQLIDVGNQVNRQRRRAGRLGRAGPGDRDQVAQHRQQQQSGSAGLHL